MSCDLQVSVYKSTQTRYENTYHVHCITFISTWYAPIHCINHEIRLVWLRIPYDKILHIYTTQTQLQREPTRETKLLDLFFTNKPTLVKTVSAIPGISDHEIVLADCNIKPTINKRAPRFIHQWRKADWEKLKSETISYGAHFIAGAAARTVSVNYQIFKQFIQDTIDQYVPERLLKIGENNLPWITPNIRRLCRKKQRLFNKAKRPNVLIVVRTGRSIKIIRSIPSSQSGVPTGIMLIPYSRIVWSQTTQSPFGVMWSPISRTPWVWLL